MFKSFIVTVIVIFLYIPVFAQSDLESELEDFYGNHQIVNEQNVDEKIVITTKTVKETVKQVPQPVTPKNTSEELRSKRYEFERETENRLAEKIEESRLEDEKNRLNKILGNKTQKLEELPQELPPPPAVEVIVIGPEVEKEEIVEPSQDIGTELLQKPVDDLSAEVEKVKVIELDDNQPSYKASQETVEKPSLVSPVPSISSHLGEYFAVFGLGFARYPKAVNIKENLMFNVGFGKTVSPKVSLEGTYHYSSYDVDLEIAGTATPAFIAEVTQHNIGMLTKYKIVEGVFNPYVGGTITYTYRDYQSTDSYKSHAFDIGAIIGGEFKTNKRFNVGMSLSYMINMAYDQKFAPDLLLPSDGLPVEEFNYYFFSLYGKINF